VSISEKLVLGNFIWILSGIGRVIGCPKKSYRAIRSKAYKYYTGIGVLICPALNGEKVYFEKAGFRHLIYKGKEPRTMNDQIRRFKSLINVKNILLEANNFTKYRVSVRKNSVAYFWSLNKRIGDKVITVVLRRINSKNIHFFSVLDE
jgi:hypothetical protein